MDVFVFNQITDVYRAELGEWIRRLAMTYGGKCDRAFVTYTTHALVVMWGNAGSPADFVGWLNGCDGAEVYNGIIRMYVSTVEELLVWMSNRPEGLGKGAYDTACSFCVGAVEQRFHHNADVVFLAAPANLREDDNNVRSFFILATGMAAVVCIDPTMGRILACMPALRAGVDAFAESEGIGPVSDQDVALLRRMYQEQVDALIRDYDGPRFVADE